MLIKIDHTQPKVAVVSLFLFVGAGSSRSVLTTIHPAGQVATPQPFLSYLSCREVASTFDVENVIEASDKCHSGMRGYLTPFGEPSNLLCTMQPV